MSLNLLGLPSEIIALIGECLEYRRDIKAFIETHPRFCCLAQLYESLYGAGTIFVHADDLITACNNGDATLARGKLKAGDLP
ncbi:ankyrin repeat-containing protein [Penicillium malachiteum]|nr:ankyrin repeat-containing protein [Penicillium malachiteum]